MDNKTSNGANGGIGFVGLLTIVFITLKLLGKISWSWLWALSPIWISLALVLVGTVIITVVYVIKFFRTKI